MMNCIFLGPKWVTWPFLRYFIWILNEKSSNPGLFWCNFNLLLLYLHIQIAISSIFSYESGMKFCLAAERLKKILFGFYIWWNKYGHSDLENLLMQTIVQIHSFDVFNLNFKKAYRCLPWTDPSALKWSRLVTLRKLGLLWQLHSIINSWTDTSCRLVHWTV